MTQVINYPLIINTTGSNLIITNSTVNNLLNTNISTISLNSTNITVGSLNITNCTTVSLNCSTIYSLTANTASGIYIGGPFISQPTIDTLGINMPNMYQVISGDVNLSSYWGVQMNMNIGGYQFGNFTNATNTRVPSNSAFTVNIKNGGSVGNLFMIKQVYSSDWRTRVGINTTNPSFTLDVNGVYGSASLRINGQSDFSPNVFLRNSNATQNFTMQGVGNGFGIALGTQSDDTMDIMINNTKYISFSTGSVRIFNGSQQASVTLSDSNKGIKYSGAANNVYFSNSYPTDGITVFGYVDGSLGTVNGSNKNILNWKSSELVGINTTNQSYTLDVNGSCKSTQFQSTTGTVSLTTSFSNVYTVSTGQRGFITIIANNGNPCSVFGFFEWTIGVSYPSIYPITWNNNGTYGSGNTTGGIELTITITGTPAIQAKFTGSATGTYYITIL